MVTITKNNQTLQVTRGAFHNYYEPMGYKMVKTKESHKKDQGSHKDPEPKKYTPEQVMSMTLDQLYAMADEHGIDYSQVRSKENLVKLILRSL